MTFSAVRSRRLFSAAIFLCLAFASRLCAQEAVFELDPAKSHVEFTLGDVLHTVHGTFKVKHGSIRVDPVTEKASGRIVVDVTSGESGSRARDRKMHRDILESQAYPEASFVPLRVVGPLPSTGESRVELQGLFTIHGVEHEIDVSGSLQVTGNHWVATTRFVVPYMAWGMKNPSTFILRVSDKVEVDIYAQGTLSQK